MGVEERKKLREFMRNAKNVANHAISKGEIRSPAHVYEQRINICSKCPHFNHSKWQCNECGCLIKAKARFVAAVCPIAKW